MSEDNIIFVNAVVDLVRCYCHDNEADAQIIFEAINMASKSKENKNEYGDQTGNNEEK